MDQCTRLSCPEGKMQPILLGPSPIHVWGFCSPAERGQQDISMTAWLTDTQEMAKGQNTKQGMTASHMMNPAFGISSSPASCCDEHQIFKWTACRARRGQEPEEVKVPKFTFSIKLLQPRRVADNDCSALKLTLAVSKRLRKRRIDNHVIRLGQGVVLVESAGGEACAPQCVPVYMGDVLDFQVRDGPFLLPLLKHAGPGQASHHTQTERERERERERETET